MTQQTYPAHPSRTPEEAGRTPAPQGGPGPTSYADVASGPAPHGPTPPAPVGSRRRGPGWGGVAAVALAAALTASGVTAALTADLSPDASASTAYDTLGAQQASVPAAGSAADSPGWQTVAARVRDSVVAITVTTSSGSGEGSGVVIGEDGHILTNDHVVAQGVGGTITVTLADGRLYRASVVGTDPTTDIAVIRLDDPPADLSVATLGNSDDTAVGAAVMAVGNPLGLDSTVTTGIVSAIDRPVTTQESGSSSAVVTNAIQVDAAVNPGNSGGPLFDGAGRVIGITSSIATLSSSASSGGSIGLGFAIPVNQAMLIADQLMASGTAEHAFLGVTLVDGTAAASGTTRRGAAVQAVTPGTPADEAGIRGGDVVVGIDGEAVGGAESLTGFVRQHASGDSVVLTVVRDGEALDIEVALTTRPVTEEAAVPAAPFGR